MKKLKLLLDFDEVVCFSGYLHFVNEFLQTSYKVDDFTNYYIEEEVIPKDRMGEFYEFVRSKDQYECPEFLPGAVDAVNRLSKYYDIYICSDCRNPFDLANSGRIFASKFNLLYNTFSQEVIPAKNYIFTGVKNIFKADVQVDDLERNFDEDIALKILFPSYHNKSVGNESLNGKGIIRASADWKTAWRDLESFLIKYAIHKENIQSCDEHCANCDFNISSQLVEDIMSENVEYSDMPYEEAEREIGFCEVFKTADIPRTFDYWCPFYFNEDTVERIRK